MKYPLATDSWNWKEKLAILKVMVGGRYTMGSHVANFEKEFADKMGSRNAVMVNSGSSANLVGLHALVLKKKIKPGSEVIVPAVSWSTTYFPITQLGLVPVFVDIDLDTFNLDIKNIIPAITSKTCAVLAVNLLGNPCDLFNLQHICQEKNIELIEDNCESLGALSMGKQAGTFGTFGTFSFFFSHHLQTMEGGMIVTDDDILADYMRSLRAHGWVRDLKTSSLYTKTGNSFEDSFKFVLPGYCVRPLEMSGAIGSVQLKKLDNILYNRRKNAEVFIEEFKDDFIIQKETLIEGGGISICNSSSWFGFGVILKNELENKREKVIEKLMKSGVEVRPIVTGNFTKQPVMKYINKYIHGELKNSEYLDKNGFFFGNDHRDLRSKIKYVRKLIG